MGRDGGGRPGRPRGSRHRLLLAAALAARLRHREPELRPTLHDRGARLGLAHPGRHGHSRPSRAHPRLHGPGVAAVAPCGLLLSPSRLRGGGARPHVPRGVLAARARHARDPAQRAARAIAGDRSAALQAPRPRPLRAPRGHGGRPLRLLSHHRRSLDLRLLLHGDHAHHGHPRRAGQLLGRAREQRRPRRPPRSAALHYRSAHGPVRRRSHRGHAPVPGWLARRRWQRWRSPRVSPS